MPKNFPSYYNSVPARIERLEHKICITAIRYRSLMRTGTTVKFNACQTELFRLVDRLMELKKKQVTFLPEIKV